MEVGSDELSQWAPVLVQATVHATLAMCAMKQRMVTNIIPALIVFGDCACCAKATLGKHVGHKYEAN